MFTASITLAVDDVSAAGQAALDAVAPLGGLLFGQQTTTEPVPRTVLVIKVLPEDFQDALARLGAIGELRSQQVSAEDVTGRIVDLESRIITGETSVQRLRVSLEGAVGLDEVAALERELLNREQTLEQLRGQLRTINDAVGLATITVTIEQIVEPEPQPGIEIGLSFYVGDDGGRGCPARDVTRIDEGETVTACFEVTNTGDTALGDIEIIDRALDIEDPRLLTDTADTVLEPDRTWLYTATFTATSSLTTESRVTATPVRVSERVGVEAGAGPSVSVVGFVLVDVTPDNSLPGFTDAFGGAVDVMRGLIGILVILAGVAVPFLWIPLIAALVLWFRRRRSASVAEDPTRSGAGVGSAAESDDAIDDD